jgi:hypothetical protein
MPNKTIAELSSITSLANEDLLLVYDFSETGAEKVKNISVPNFFEGYATDGDLTSVSGALQNQLSNLSQDKISEGNSSVEVVDAGTGEINFVADGKTTAKFLASESRLYVNNEVAMTTVDVEGNGIALGANNSHVQLINNDGHLHINLSEPSKQMYILGNSGVSARFIDNSDVELYYAGVKKFETTNTGATVTGDLVITGSGTMGGLPIATQSFINNMFSYNAGTHEITFKGHLIPDTDDTWNIGSPSKKIAELYVSATTVHIGDTATFSGTSLAITGGTNPTSTGQTPTMQASSLVLQPFIYNPGAGNVTVDPKLQFINSSGQQYGMSFNVGDNEFSFDGPTGAGKGNIKVDKLTAGTIETTGNTQILFKQAVRTDGNVTLGYDENNSVVVKGILDLRTPVTFGQAATLGDGNDTVAVNCGAANKFTVNSQYFGINSNGLITASGITTTGNSEVGGNLNIVGDLSVQGNNFVVNTQTVIAEDNLIVINSNETGAGVTAGVAGIEVERGSSTNYQFYFDEGQDNFRVGISGSLQAVATREDTPTSGGVATWNAAQYRFDTTAVGTAFNKNFGTISGTICQGDDSRLSDARPPSSHNNTYHSETYITSAGVTYANLNGNSSVGTGATQVAQGNHSHSYLPLTGGQLTGTLSISAAGNTKADGYLYTGTTDPTNSTRLNYDGYFYATRVYNTYLNDIADFQKVIGEQIPGKCYYDTLNGALICSARCQKSVIGILSDTFGIAAGVRNDPEYGPIAVAGWALAYVDDVCEPGDVLTNGPNGNLVKMTREEKLECPERIVATYKKPETTEFWGPNNEIKVNGRHWVKVR